MIQLQMIHTSSSLSILFIAGTRLLIVLEPHVAVAKAWIATTCPGVAGARALAYVAEAWMAAGYARVAWPTPAVDGAAIQ